MVQAVAGEGFQAGVPGRGQPQADPGGTQSCSCQQGAGRLQKCRLCSSNQKKEMIVPQK